MPALYSVANAIGCIENSIAFNIHFLDNIITINKVNPAPQGVSAILSPITCYLTQTNCFHCSMDHFLCFYFSNFSNYKSRFSMPGGDGQSVFYRYEFLFYLYIKLTSNMPLTWADP